MPELISTQFSLVTRVIPGNVAGWKIYIFKKSVLPNRWEILELQIRLDIFISVGTISFHCSTLFQRKPHALSNTLLLQNLCKSSCNGSLRLRSFYLFVCLYLRLCLCLCLCLCGAKEGHPANKFWQSDVLFFQTVASSQRVLCGNLFWSLVTCLAGVISIPTSIADLKSVPPLR